MRSLCLPAVCTVLSLACIFVAPVQADEVEIARNTAGMLTVHSHAPSPFPLEASVFPSVAGFASQDLPFMNLEHDHPSSGLFRLPDNVDIRLTLLDLTPNMHVYIGAMPMVVGQEITLGSPDFLHAPIWNITAGNPGDSFYAIFSLRDASGQLAGSGPFVLRFTPVPAPGMFGLLGAAGVAVAAGKRRRHTP